MSAPAAVGAESRRGETDRAPDGLGHGRRLDFGPDHPITRAGYGLRVDVEAERIVAARVEIAARHRGLEERLAERPWYQAVPLVERVSPVSGALAGVALCRAVERLLDVEVPERGEWLRVLMGELGRMADHLRRLGGACRWLGAPAQAAWLGEAEGRIVDWTAALTGARSATHFVRLGGVCGPLPASLAGALRGVLAVVESAQDDVERSVGRMRGFVARLRGVAVFEREACARHGASGVIQRAAGTPTDLRKEPDQGVYPELDFEVVVGSVGDNYDRFLVCAAEVRQCVRIVTQCLDRLEALGPGAVRLADPRLVWPTAAGERLGLAETIHHSLGVTRGPRVPAGEAYAAVEGANGELGFHVVSDGGPIPVRVDCRAPGFFHARALETLLVGVPLAELGTTLELINLDASECSP